jgi:hypothetical protein
MDNESAFRRKPPVRPYALSNARLSVPGAAVTATLELLRRAGRRESGLFWYGPRDAAGNGRVTYVAAPRQRMTWGNYHVSPVALAEIVNKLPDDCKPLAQVHSHPGVNVEHSPYDDDMASSRRALSLVFPLYGQSNAPFPNDVGVHEWQDQYWHLLDRGQAAKRLVLTTGDVRVEDLR